MGDKEVPEEPNKCPLCHSTTINMNAYRVIGGGMDVYCECFICGCQGPCASTDEDTDDALWAVQCEARKLWNKAT